MSSLSEKRSRAGKKGMLRRYGPPAGSIESESTPIHKSPVSGELGGSADLLSDPDPTVALRLREYSQLVGMPTDWSDARTLEQVRAEIIKTSHNALDLQAARGRLVERKELDLMAAKIRDTWWREAQLIAPAVLALLSALPLETRSQIKVAIDTEVAATASRVKTEIAA